MDRAAAGRRVRCPAGRGAANNADYRDLIPTSLIVDADYLVLAMTLQYRAGTTVVRSYERTREQIDAIYESEPATAVQRCAAHRLLTTSGRPGAHGHAS